MNNKDIAEQAYKNGYEQAIKDLECNSFKTSWKGKFLEAKKENAEQKAEIERLKADYIALDLEARELRTESDKMVAEHLAFVELAKKADEQQADDFADKAVKGFRDKGE